MKRFEDYKQEVIQAYEKKKKNEVTFPHNLHYPTPANLKNECLNVFQNRYSGKDNGTFKAIFREKDSAEAYFTAIQTAEADQFKALSNFLKGNTKNTSDRYIELLAWLIDFQPRPHIPATGYEIDLDKPKNKSVPEQETTVPTPGTTIEETPVVNTIDIPVNGTETSEDNDSTGTDSPGNAGTDKGVFGIPRKLYKTIAVCVLTFVVLSGSYFFYIINRPDCMYWDGDQYQYIDCDQRQDYGTIILPVDAYKFAHLKRIKKRSQIRRSDIGKVHYSKINNEVEFYTVKSENPTDTARKLLPMTSYIFNKYVLHQP